MEINYQSLLLKNDVNYPSIKKGLNIVKEFITRKGLILLGGQAIDFALRAKGDKLYNDDQIPDYDFYSPDHYQDAIELGNLLCDNGLENISIIRAFHITTIKVRINFIPVADISYCPKVVFDRVPFINYKGIKVIHPITQMIDQHNSLTYPYKNPQWGGNVTRWEKDITRYAILNNHYKIPESAKKICQYDITLPSKLIKDVCITGYAGHAIYDNDYSLKKSQITISTYVQEFMILTDTIEDTVKLYTKTLNIKDVKYFNPMLDQFPYHAELQYGKWTIYIIDNFGEYVGANYIGELCVSSVHWIFMYYLRKEDYASYNLLKESTKNSDTLATDWYGKYNNPQALDLLRKIFDDSSARKTVPRNLYPDEQCDVSGEFDYNSTYFAIDGEQIDKTD